MRRTIVILILTLITIVVSNAPIENACAHTYPQLPPAGIAIDPALRQTLVDRVRKIQTKIDETAKHSSDAASWVPDVEVLVRAIRLALEQNLFYKESDAEFASTLLDDATRRLSAVQRDVRGLALLGLADAVQDQPQLLVGGFRSSIDDSVQPYGLVIPANYLDEGVATRVDVWLHGRGDTKTEVPFLRERMTKVGLYSPEKTIVLHPFGRHCNAFKFAGETDVDEALAHL